MSATRVGVVGHVEWVQFAVVERVPVSGEIVHARETFAEPAGGGAVAAVQLRKLAGAAQFLTALGNDAVAAGVERRLDELGVSVHAAQRPKPQRRTFTYLDDGGERTITVLGERIVPWRSDPLPWDDLAQLDAIYLTGGDPEAVRAARAARVLVATPRAHEALAGSGIQLDVLVRSATDPGEAYEPGTLDPAPRFVVGTRGGLGGSWTGETSGTWQATPLPGPAVDSYGCGDSFAAALAFGLGAGMALPEAIELGARCGAACLCGRGPYAGQLDLA
ncbi:MAG TPA: PfkB family carbohydrate kinase [Solirubrobacteraceae bacterium]|nr:PfkB family carbohydrate kinase [Solirubrobacteraceae bacterium]